MLKVLNFNIHRLRIFNDISRPFACCNGCLQQMYCVVQRNTQSSSSRREVVEPLVTTLAQEYFFQNNLLVFVIVSATLSGEIPPFR